MTGTTSDRLFGTHRPGRTPAGVAPQAAAADTPLRAGIAAALQADEATLLRALSEAADLTPARRAAISSRAAGFVRDIRRMAAPGLMEVFLAEYGLSTQEGVALMCLAEAMLRVPDAPTIDALIEDKIAPADWGRHLGGSSSILVNASTWALMLTGRVLDDPEGGLGGVLQGALRRLGEPVIRTAVGRAMREMGNQFVLGETIEAAMERAGRSARPGLSHSYDMLGEAARTEADARRYYLSYADAITALSRGATSRNVADNPGISVKLSALHPRYEEAQRDRVMTELVPRLKALAGLARAGNMGLNIDAEEADRLELSLDIAEAVLAEPELAGWDGFGMVVQAYGRRAGPVIDWLHDLAGRLDRRIMLRLVKGAYWDSEIKRAQVLGLRDFPVFTVKAGTDVSYIALARRLLDMRDRIFPQFATHNAHTMAAILNMAGCTEGGGAQNTPARTPDWEFQRLHGMGAALHELVAERFGTRHRIYAPVGRHRDLLAYLVRRLLENGANSSFVNQVVNDEVPPEIVAADPFEALARRLGDATDGMGAGPAAGATSPTTDAPGDATAGDGAAGDGSAGDGSAGDGAAGDGAVRGAATAAGGGSGGAAGAGDSAAAERAPGQDMKASPDDGTDAAAASTGPGSNPGADPGADPGTGPEPGIGPDTRIACGTDRPRPILNAAIRPGPALFLPQRANSRGHDLADRADLAGIEAARAPWRDARFHAAPILAAPPPSDRTGQASPVRNPARPQEVVGTVREATDAEISAALDAATPWHAPAAERAAVLRRAAELYEANAGRFWALAAREAGKTLPDAIGELREAVDFLHYYAAQAPGLSGAPRGVFAAISPWNFPLAIFTGQIAAALAAGNGVIAKPAEQTPLMAHEAVSLLLQAGVPATALQLLPGDGPRVGGRLLSEPRLCGVCFTGGTDTAHAIHATIAEHLTPDAPLIAETGGLNAMVVDSTALPEQAVRDILASAFQSAGQRCSALRCLYLQRDVADTVLEMLIGAMDELRPGDPWDLSTDIGPVIDADAAAGIEAHVERARADGRLLHRLNRAGPGHFCAPALIRVDGIGDLQREVFGPVLHVATFEASELEQVFRDINATGYGLTFGMHSRIDDRIQAAVDAVHAGNIYINRNQIGAVVGSQPFGGEGLSGTGPKAGGPLYLTRFRLGSRAPAAPGALNLPGPTGESNRLRLMPRAGVLCLGPGTAEREAQIQAARAVGCGVRTAEGDPVRAAEQTDASLILWQGDAETGRAIRRALAARPGPIRLLSGDPGDAALFVTERHVCIDTTAAGGNAALLAEAGGA